MLQMKKAGAQAFAGSLGAGSVASRRQQCSAGSGVLQIKKAGAQAFAASLGAGSVVSC